MERVLDQGRFRRLQAALAGQASLEGFTPEEIQQARAAADARGRELYGESTRTGGNLQARTPAELQRLGATSLSQRAPGGATSRNSPQSVLDNAKQQGRAAISGAMDEITFGLADRALSVADAAAKTGNLHDFGQAYDENMDQKRAEDAYDEAHYGTARTTGQIAGDAAGIAVAGVPGVGRALIPRLLPNAARAVANANRIRRIGAASREGLNAMAAVGGGMAGGVSQAFEDVAHGRISSPGAYAGAVGGGAIGGLAALRGGAAGQAVGSGRLPDAREVASAAYGGAVAGRGIGAVGKYGSNALSKQAKGALGEGLSVAKTLANGELPILGKSQVLLKGGGKTFPDHRVSRVSQLLSGQTLKDVADYAEAKFGPYASLSKGQTKALRQFGDRFRVDHWLPTDVGQAFGVAFGSLGAPLSRANGRR